MTPHHFSYPRVVPLKSGDADKRADRKDPAKGKPSPPAKPRPRRTQGR